MIRALTSLILLLAIPATAAAQEAAPVPDCHGITVTDKEGDSANAVSGDAGSKTSDLIGAFIRYDGTKATANIQVAELTEGEVDPPYVAIGWEMNFNTSAGARFVRAYMDRAGIVKYTWAEPSEVGDTSDHPGGDTTGKLFPGPKGIIQIDIPLEEMGAKPGTELKSIALEVRQWASLPAAVPSTGLPLVYPAPIYDDATGKGTVKLAPCTAGTPLAPGAPGGPAAPAPAPAGPPTPSGPATFDIKAKFPKLSAKKLAKSRTFTVALTGNASSLKAAVRAGTGPNAKVLGGGRLATLKGKGKLKIKLKGKIKKGKYVLALSGKNANGAAAEGAVSFRVR